MNTINNTPDIVLIGAGIMSATLGVLLKKLNPSLTIEAFERLEYMAGESSNAWNNAGTGHSAFCELNYTPLSDDGVVDVKKAIKICESFEVSKQFWSYLVEQKIITNPEKFIRSIPHLSFVWGDEDVDFLKKRYDALQMYHPFKPMKYSETHAELTQWMPAVMQNRDVDQKVAATKMDLGTDVDFGELTKELLTYLDGLDGVNINLAHDVNTINRIGDDASNGYWDVEITNLKNEIKRNVSAKFIFIGAGGGSLPLLEKSEIPEGKGFGGFPVSGQWLRCKNKEVIEKHYAKVYGKAKVGAPPMSVPHLDTRIIDGERALLFGPYAGFSTKFLKNGSYWDLPSSIKWGNIIPMLSTGFNNIPLTQYLINEVQQTPEEKLETLKEFLPDAKMEDWGIEIAGQRVQVIKKDEENGGGVLEFGTEIVSCADGSLAALLGASPGASTSVGVMLDVIKRCYPNEMKTADWQQKIKEMIPSYGQSLTENPQLCDDIRERTSRLLELKA